MILLTFSVSTLREKVGLCTPYLFGYNTGSRAKVPQLWDLFDSKECKQTSCYGCNDFMVRLMVNSTVYVHVCQGSRNILGTDHDIVYHVARIGEHGRHFSTKYTGVWTCAYTMYW